MSSPVPMFGTQNTSDDDGPVIDSFFIETDAPPKIADAQVELNSGPQEALKIPKPTDRLIAGNLTFKFTGAFQSPTQILPADANRTGLTLSVFSYAASPNGATEYVSFADENGKCLTTGAMNIRHGKDPYTLSYNGPVFVQASSTITADIELTWVSVTS